MLDFAGNCLDEAVRADLGDGFTFQQHDLNKPVPIHAQYGYCTDVMEHIPEQDIAAMCAFLGSPGASWINGAVIPVDGGWMANGGPE